MENELYTTIIGIVTLVLLAVGLILIFYCEAICNKKEKEFIETLNEHDQAVICKYNSVRKFNVKDFKQEKDKKDNENI